MPVYKGGDLIAKTLENLRRQTFRDFEAIISVDGGDAETAAVCQPFLADPRFRMVVHPERLDWVGNFNWLLQQDLREFFCYRQHDDTTAPDFFEILVSAADRKQNAAAIYCDCQHTGLSDHVEATPSIEGREPLHRIFQLIERLPHIWGPPLRGIIRTAAIRQAGLVRSDEFRAPLQVLGWLAMILRSGNFRRVGKPLYYRLHHAHSFGKEYARRAAQDRRESAFMTVFTGLLEAAMPMCRTSEQRLLFQQTILGRIVAFPYFHPNERPDAYGKVVDECMARLRHEGNVHLLREEELPAILQGFQRRLDEIRLSEHSRIQKGIYQIRQQHRLAKVIYPKSIMPRLSFQIRNLFAMFGKISRLLLRQ